ncbi:hypothetical protein LCGC14_2542680 [marine sediment metagenome]|uniref:Uncharacterized protein n=1 Tax=marine sediment metagenome TaxID=412755 RepID=A0A0F9AQR0_9ZZZZ
MARLKSVPKSAQVVEVISGIINKGELKGHKITVTRKEGYSSHGFQSNYQHVPHVWIIVERENTRTWVNNYSGCNLELADKDWSEAREIITV